MTEVSPTEGGKRLVGSKVPEISGTVTPTSPPSKDRQGNHFMGGILSALNKLRGNRTKPEAVLREIAVSPFEANEAKNGVINWVSPPSRGDVLALLRRYPTLTGRTSDPTIRGFSLREGQWEVVTSELVNGMADYFAIRAADLGKSDQDPLRIVEVGAGSGRLAYFIQNALELRGLDKIIKYYATDIVSRTPKHGAPPVEIKNLFHGVNYQDAVDPNSEQHMPEELKMALNGKPPDIVLAVWPSPMQDGKMGEDWTWAFRKAGVKEYILIGDPKVCGQLDNTWGLMQGIGNGLKPAYQTDGLGYHKETNLDPSLTLIPLLGAGDDIASDEPSRSQIAVFRKR